MRGLRGGTAQGKCGSGGGWTLPNVFVLQGEVGMPGHKGSKGDKGDSVSGPPREGMLMGGDGLGSASLSRVLAPSSLELKVQRSLSEP